MTGTANLTADVFLARAAVALTRPAGPGGDHVLNPDLSPEGLRLTEAAVLVPVIARDEATVLLTQRTADLRTHAGQIAFPGGKIEADDPTAAAAALREAEEEVGLDPRLVKVVAELPAYLSRTGFRITPVLARIAAEHALTLNLSEVTETFEVPLAFLLNPANHIKASRVFDGATRYFWEIPYEGRYIWGVTAGIIRGLYEQVCR